MRKIYLLLVLFIQFIAIDKTIAQCTTAPYGAYGSLTPTCTGAYQNVTTCGYRGEYSTITVTAGNAYSFQSSAGADIVTITTTANAVLAWATGTANWTATFSGQVRFYTHGAGCATGTGCRTKRVMCAGAPPAAPANNLVCSATAITCGATLIGTTVNATNSGTGENGACGTAQTMPGVWYVVAGNGQTMTASLCATAWDSKISVFSGTNCSTLTCVGGIDDGGPACTGTSASYSWPSVVGQNYYILVHGWAANSAFSLNLSCVTPCSPPSNDLCANAPILDLGANNNQTHYGTGSCSTPNLGTYKDVWVAFTVPCGGMNVTIDFCGSTPVHNNAYINISPDCSFTTFTGATTWDFTSCVDGNIRLYWNNVPAGTYYYPILIDPTWETNYVLNISGTPLYTPAVAPTSISGTTTVCSGQSTTLTLQGGSAGTNGIAEWFEGSCGSAVIGTGNSLPVSPTVNTTYFVRFAGSCNTTACVSVPVTINTASTAPLLSGPSSTICPNSTATLTASGGTAGAGSQIEWWTGPNGTGTNLGTGSSANVSPSTSTTYYVRRSGTCNTTVDETINVNVKSFTYAANNTSSAGYCTDNAGWNHFFNGDNIIFSVQGDLSGLPVGFPIASIFDNGTYFSESQFPSGGAGCASNQNPGEQRFEMERAWDLNFGGGTPSGTYSVRFYHETVERQAVETAAANYMAAYPSCGYSYLYGAAQFATNGFYLFKNTGSAYSAPDYDGLHLQSLTGTTANGINYAQMSGVTSFSGGSGAIILAPISALPVELISFTANCNETGDKVNVNWSTASEHNTSYFVVEKSRDGINWTILNTLGAAGNSTTVIEYALTDNNVVSGTTYYRLTQFDNDGVSETFNIASVNCGAQQAITSNLITYPNPSNGSFYVDFYTQDITGPSLISVFDARGMVIYRQEVLVEKGSNVFHIEDLEAAPGMYYIKVSNGTTTSYIVKHSLR